MQPPNARSGPQSPTGNRPSKPSSTAAAKPQGPSPDRSLRRGARTRGRYPAADASLYAPVPGRAWWWLSVRCPRCRGVHLARVRDAAQAPGPRRIPCGLVRVIIRRTYGASA
jgi:hypothetical protein